MDIRETNTSQMQVQGPQERHSLLNCVHSDGYCIYRVMKNHSDGCRPCITSQQTITLYTISHVQASRHFIHLWIHWNLEYILHHSVGTTDTVSLAPLWTSPVNTFKWLNESEAHGLCCVWLSSLRYCVSARFSGVFVLWLLLSWQKCQEKF